MAWQRYSRKTLSWEDIPERVAKERFCENLMYPELAIDEMQSTGRTRSVGRFVYRFVNENRLKNMFKIVLQSKDRQVLIDAMQAVNRVLQQHNLG